MHDKDTLQIKDKAEKFEKADPKTGFYLLRDRWQYTRPQPEQWSKCWCGSKELMNWCSCGARYHFVIRGTGPDLMAGYEQTTELEYRYRLTSTGYSSRRYGNCEICSEHCSEVFIQTENVRYNPRRGLRNDLPYDDNMRNEGKPSGWTFYGCFSYFGHEECLLAKRR